MSFIALYTAVLLLMTGIGLLGTYLPLRLTLDGASTQVIGLVTSCYFLGLFIGALYCQRLIARVGHIRSFAAFAALTTAIIMLHGLFVSPLFWALLRFLAGLSTIGLYTVIESWLNACTEPEQRGKVLSIYMVITYLGMTLGQLLLNLGDPASLTIFFIAGLLLALCSVPVAVTHAIHPELPPMGRFNVVSALKRSPTGMLGALTAGLLNSAFYSIAPVFCHRHGFSVQQLSLVMTITILGGLTLQWPVGRFSDRFDRTYVLAAISLAMAMLASFILTFGAGFGFVTFLSTMAVFGGLLFTLYPVAVARAHDLFDRDAIVAVSAALLLYYAIGATAGPMLASTCMTLLNNAFGYFAFSALVALGYALITFYLRRWEIVTIVPAKDNVQFMAMKSTSPAVVLIDPRSELDEPASETNEPQQPPRS